MDFIIFTSFTPEAFLSLSILFQLVFNIKLINNFKYNFPIIDKEVFYQTLFILISLFFLYSNLKIEGFFSNFLFLNDESTRIVKILMLLTCFFSLNSIIQTFSIQKLNFFEFFVIFLLSIFSLLLLISATDLISFYLVIEMQSLCFYILSSFKRDSSFSTEAGLKYFISGAFISGIFLFGSSLIYGCLGTLNFNALNLLLAFPVESTGNGFDLVLLIGIVCVTTTLLFKIACAPFHFWAPDVYEGSPLSSTIIFSIVPKIALIYFFIKWILSINAFFFFHIQEMLVICGVLSAFVGTFYALSQNRLKKLIIYSSIAQVGFLVVGLSTKSLGGFTAVFFFLIIYIITSILIWSHFSLFYYFNNKIGNFYNKNFTSLFISSLTNFFGVNKLWAFSFVVIFFSIGGIPPLTGFLSKVLVLFEVIACDNIIAAVMLIILSSISVFYYIRMIKIMYFEPKTLEKNYEKVQIIFYNKFLDNIYVMSSLLLLLLLSIFFAPTFLMLNCENIILNIKQFGCFSPDLLFTDFVNSLDSYNLKILNYSFDYINNVQIIEPKVLYVNFFKYKINNLLVLIYVFFHLFVFLPRILKIISLILKLILNLKVKKKFLLLIKEHNEVLKRAFGPAGISENFNLCLVVSIFLILKILFKYFMIKYNVNYEYLSFEDYKFFYRIISDFCFICVLFVHIKITLMKLEFLFKESIASSNLKNFFKLLESFSLIISIIYFMLYIINIFAFIFFRFEFFSFLVEITYF